MSQSVMGLFVLLLRMPPRQEVNEALQKLSKAVGKAQDGKLSDALKLFKSVLEVIPEHVDARRNLCKVYA